MVEQLTKHASRPLRGFLTYTSSPCNSLLGPTTDYGLRRYDGLVPSPLLYLFPLVNLSLVHTLVSSGQQTRTVQFFTSNRPLMVSPDSSPTTLLTQLAPTPATVSSKATLLSTFPFHSMPASQVVWIPMSSSTPGQSNTYLQLCRHCFGRIYGQ